MIELCHNRHPCASIYHLGFTAQKRREPFLCVHRGKPRNVASIRVKNDCSRRYCDTSINYPYTDKGHPHTEKPTIILIRYYYTDESFLGFSGERKTIVNACFLICSYQHLHRGSTLLCCKRHYLTISQYSTAKLHIIFQLTKKRKELFLANCLMLPCFLCRHTFLIPFPSLPLFQIHHCPSSTTSKSTSSTSVSRCRRGRQTDVDDVDFGAISVSFGWYSVAEVKFSSYLCMTKQRCLTFQHES
jgi:hypothetical protein